MSTPSERTTRQNSNQQIGNYIGKLLRDTFGKGPESVYVAASQTCFVVYLRNFMSPMEKILIEHEQEATVFEMRAKLMESLFPEIRAYVRITTGIQLREFYCDWNFTNQSGVLVGVSQEAMPSDEPAEDYVGKSEIEQEVIRISAQAERAPDEITSFALNHRTLVVVRAGILVRIEKEFIRHGQESLLRRVKATLEKSHLETNEHFEEFLKRRIVDIFVDWDFDRDKSVIVMILGNKR
ncbi:DUF2294 family protein [Alicyclobacillus curvatus]|nr:DUF2294 family protein [Alicyclobacillus curvatus]